MKKSSKPMKNKKSKIDWENLFEGSSSTEEAMYYFVFGKYGIDGFKKDCTYQNDDEVYLDEEQAKAFKQMRKMGVKAARQDCKNWMTAIYGPNHYQEILEDYCQCHCCPIHGKDNE